ncbi:Sensor histidine kinase DesK [Pseudoclavibacter triregionum]|nr:Sensor histidine kinase DesK [Pseudoclavibacter triregionum]
MTRSSSAASASSAAPPAEAAAPGAATSGAASSGSAPSPRPRPQSAGERGAIARLPAPGRTRFGIRPRPMTWLNWVVDIAFAVAFEAILGWPYLVRADFSVVFAWALVPAVLLYTVALAARRCLPGPMLALGLIAFALKIVLVLPPHGCDLALFILIFSAAAFGSRTSQTAAAITAVGAPLALIVYVVAVPQDAALWQLLGLSMSTGIHIAIIVGAVVVFLFAIVGLLFWAAGILRRMQLRSRDAQHRRELAELESQRSREQLIVEQERNRIARDMHDVVAHSLAVVVAQADGGRYMVRANPAAAEPTLQTIAEIAREALVDVRGLLAQLRHSQGEGPQAGLDDVATVMERMQGAGLRIEHSIAGQRRPIGQTAELAVYRLVQESLTNALRHGDPAAPTRLRVTWTPEHLEVLIENRVNPVPPPPRPGSGHGLIGMRERIAMIGGEVETGRIGDVFRVRAVVPCQPSAARSTGPIALVPMTAPAAAPPEPGEGDTREIERIRLDEPRASRSDTAPVPGLPAASAVASASAPPPPPAGLSGPPPAPPAEPDAPRTAAEPGAASADGAEIGHPDGRRRDDDAPRTDDPASHRADPAPTERSLEP